LHCTYCGHLHDEVHNDISEKDQYICQSSSFAGLTYAGEPEYSQVLGYALGQFRFTSESDKAVLLHWPRKIKVKGEQRKIVLDTNFDLVGLHTFSRETSLLKPYLSQKISQSSRTNEPVNQPKSGFQSTLGKLDSEYNTEEKSASTYSKNTIKVAPPPPVSQSIFEKHGNFWQQLESPIEVFISYSRKDKILLKQLMLQFAWLKRQQHVDFYFDEEKINAGERWEIAINEHIKTAPVILLLLSSDFSNFQ